MLLLAGCAAERASAERRGLYNHVCACVPALMGCSLNDRLRYCCWCLADAYRHAWLPVAKVALGVMRCHPQLASQTMKRSRGSPAQGEKTPELAAN